MLQLAYPELLTALAILVMVAGMLATVLALAACTLGGWTDENIGADPVVDNIPYARESKNEDLEVSSTSVQNVLR